MRRLTLLLVVLFVALPMAAPAQTPQWIVRDGTGSVVGPVLPGASWGGPDILTPTNWLWVARLAPGGNWLRFRLTSNAVLRNDPVPFLYEAPDCSSPALLDAAKTSNEVLTPVLFDTEVYWAAGAAESRFVRAKGVLVPDVEQCHGTFLEPRLCCSTLADEEIHFSAPVSGTRLAELHLQMPFRLDSVAPAAPPSNE